MRLFEKKSSFNKISRSPVFIILAIIAAIFLVQVAYSAYQKSIKSELLRQDVAVRQSELEERKDFIQAALGRFQTPAGIEEEIREKFGVEKEGERTVIIIEDANNSLLMDNETGGNLWDKLKSILGI